MSKREDKEEEKTGNRYTRLMNDNSWVEKLDILDEKVDHIQSYRKRELYILRNPSER